MLAHFRTSHRDRNDPRMHYFAVIVEIHNVCIGYVGPHLTSIKID